MNIRKIITFTFLVCGISVASAKEFTIVAEEKAPFEFVDDSGNVVGMDVDLTKAIFKKMNMEVKFVILPWSRAWDMVEKGEADASLTTSRKDKRKPFVVYPEQDLWTSEFTIFSAKSGKGKAATSYTDIASGNLKIGTIKGNSYNDEFWATFPDQNENKRHKQIKEAASLATNFQKLGSKRIDVIVDDRIVGAYTFSKLLGLSNIQDNSVTLFSKGYPMAFSKKSSFDVENLVKQYDTILAEMKSNGEYDAIMNNWIK